MTPTDAWAVLDRDGNIRSVRLRDRCEDYDYTNMEVPVLIVPRPSADGVQTEVLHALLAECFRKHHGGWNDESSDSEPCPLSYDDPEPGETCSCGASAWNARVDAVLHGTPVLIVPRPSADAPGLPMRSDAELVSALRVRASSLVGEPWEAPATAAMMREAADRIERTHSPDPVVAALREVREIVLAAMENEMTVSSDPNHWNVGSRKAARHRYHAYQECCATLDAAIAKRENEQ